MGLYLRGNTWWIEFRQGNKKIRYSTKTQDRNQALFIYHRDKLQRTQMPLQSTQMNVPIPTYTPAPKPPISNPTASHPQLTLQDLWNDWALVASDKKSFKDDISRFKQIIKLIPASTPVNNLNIKLLNDFKETLKKDNYANGTINRHLTLLKSMVNLAVNERKMEYSPIKNTRLLREDNQRTYIIYPNVFKELLKTPIQDLRLLVGIGYYTAMRLSEIVSMKKQDIDLDKNVIRIPKSKNGFRREVPISTYLKAALENFTPFTRTSKRYSQLFAEWVKKADIKDKNGLVFHSLRHTRTTLLMRHNKGDLARVQAITGHKDVKMLLRYVHLDTGDLQEAMVNSENWKTVIRIKMKDDVIQTS